MCVANPITFSVVAAAQIEGQGRQLDYVHLTLHLPLGRGEADICTGLCVCCRTVPCDKHTTMLQSLPFNLCDSHITQDDIAERQHKMPVLLMKSPPEDMRHRLPMWLNVAITARIRCGTKLHAVNCGQQLFEHDPWLRLRCHIS